MGSISLFSSSTGVYGTTSQDATTDQTQTNASNKTQDTQSQQDDTVKLSSAALAKQLYHQGETVKTIASELGTTTKDVDSYLNITEEKALEEAIQSSVSA